MFGLIKYKSKNNSHNVWLASHPGAEIVVIKVASPLYTRCHYLQQKLDKNTLLSYSVNRVAGQSLTIDNINSSNVKKKIQAKLYNDVQSFPNLWCIHHIGIIIKGETQNICISVARYQDCPRHWKTKNRSVEHCFVKNIFTYCAMTNKIVDIKQVCPPIFLASLNFWFNTVVRTKSKEFKQWSMKENHQRVNSC